MISGTFNDGSSYGDRTLLYLKKRDIGQQLALWRHGDKLDRLTQRLVALHRELLTNSQAAELLLAQGLADIARVAVARAR